VDFYFQCVLQLLTFQRLLLLRVWRVQRSVQLLICFVRPFVCRLTIIIN
jgi:hypothetical protein